MIGYTSSAVVLLRYTALAIDTVDVWGLSNEARRELLPKKSKITLYFLFITR